MGGSAVNSEGNRTRILFVSGDPSARERLCSPLENEFSIDLAGDPIEGLKKVQGNEEYAAVVADTFMPGIDGAALLINMRRDSPNTLRVMLAGDADLEFAKRAVNEAGVYRLLTKSPSLEELRSTLRSCVDHYHEVRRGAELTKSTVAGAIGIMMEVTNLSNPAAFSRGLRLRQYARHITRRLGFEKSWEYETAAMLSEFGCVILMPDLMRSVYSGRGLSQRDEERFRNHPRVGHDLVAKIPRLELVAEIILAQNEPALPPRDSHPQRSKSVRDGAQVVRVGLAFDQLLCAGLSREEALADLSGKPDKYDQRIVSALQGFRSVCHPGESRMTNVHDLRAGMVLREDLRTINGALLASTGQELTDVLVTTLKNFMERGAVKQSVRVTMEVGKDRASHPVI